MRVFGLPPPKPSNPSRRGNLGLRLEKENSGFELVGPVRVGLSRVEHFCARAQMCSTRFFYLFSRESEFETMLERLENK